MSRHIHNRKRRQIAAASLHMLAMSGDFNAQLQFNVAEARSIAYETDARRLLRKNAFEKADHSTRRLFGNMEEMKASAHTAWQKQQVSVLQKLLTRARENVLAHLSDSSAQSTFILLSQFLGISPELAQVHRADHSAKMDAAALVAKSSMSFIPGAGPILGTMARAGLKVHSTQHSQSRRRGEHVQFDHEASNIVRTSASDLGGSGASTTDARPSVSSNMPQRRQSMRAGQRSVPGRGRGRGRGRGLGRGLGRGGARGGARARGEGGSAAQSASAGGGMSTSPDVASSAPNGAARDEREAARRDATSESAQAHATRAQRSMSGGGDVPSAAEDMGQELSETQRREAAIELYRKQRRRLQTVLVVKARDKQVKGLARGKGGGSAGGSSSSSGREAKPLLAQKRKEASEFLKRVGKHVGEQSGRRG